VQRRRAGRVQARQGTLLNALLGRPLLPAGVLPLTSVVTIVGSGPRDRLTVNFADGSVETPPISMLARYVTEAENPENVLGVQLTTVETHHELLDGGIQLVDTPGVGSIHAHNTEAAHAFVARADAAIVVLSTDQPLSAQERELLAVVDRIAGRVLVVLNRIDRVDPAESVSAVAFVEAAITSAASDVPPVLAVSALERTGIEKLRRWIGELPRGDAGLWNASERAARRALARAAAEGRAAANVELAALELPLAQLDERAAIFAGRVEALSPAREAASAVLEREVAMLLRERATEPLRVLALESAARLQGELARHAQRSEARSTRQFRDDLTVWVDEEIHRLMNETAVRIEESLSSGLTELVARHAAHVDEILAELADGVAEAFGERPHWAAAAIDIRERAPLPYKLRDEGEGALGAAISATRTAIPGKIGRRLVRREQDVRLSGMIDRHAGRLREQIAVQTTSTACDYEAELRRVVDEAAEGVSARIDRARAELELGAERVSARRAALIDVAAACASVAEIVRMSKRLQ
jgi:signal recognition particle receptor subunit beta